MKRHQYTPDEIANAWKADLLNDAKHSEAQAENGPYYPKRGITKESLLEYAAKCRKEAGKSIPRQFAFPHGVNGGPYSGN